MALLHCSAKTLHAHRDTVTPPTVSQQQRFATAKNYEALSYIQNYGMDFNSGLFRGFFAPQSDGEPRPI